MSTLVKQEASGEVAWTQPSTSVVARTKGPAAQDVGLHATAIRRSSHRSRRAGSRSGLGGRYGAMFAQAQDIPVTDARWDGPRTALAPLWDDAEIAAALAAHDLTTVLRAVQSAFGLSQRQLAVLTGQSQSEICDVLTGKRHIVSYHLLVRIADGLGIPRWRMGLSKEPPHERPPRRTAETDDTTAAVRLSPAKDRFGGAPTVSVTDAGPPHHACAALTESGQQQPNSAAPRAARDHSEPLSHGTQNVPRQGDTARTNGLPSSWWDRPDIAAALANHDFAAVFAFLREHGLTEAHIAERVQLRIARVCAILNRRSTLDTYRDLIRFCDTWGIPHRCVGLAPAQPAGGCECQTRPTELPEAWTGRHIRALRTATRQSQRSFANTLGVTDGMQAKWENSATSITPRGYTQRRLDSILLQLSPDALALYRRLL